MPLPPVSHSCCNGAYRTKNEMGHFRNHARPSASTHGLALDLCLIVDLDLCLIAFTHRTQAWAYGCSLTSFPSVHEVATHAGKAHTLLMLHFWLQPGNKLDGAESRMVLSMTTTESLRAKN
jgi:hypothetical protein